MTGEEFLPIGSVVKLNNLDTKVVITGFFLKDNVKMYDYCGIKYPKGVLSKTDYLCFDKKDIFRIIKLGYRDNDCIVFLDNVKKISSNKKN